MFDDLGGAALVPCDHWEAGGHGFEDDESEDFRDAGMYEHVARCIRPAPMRDPGTLPKACKRDVRLDIGKSTPDVGFHCWIAVAAYDEEVERKMLCTRTCATSERNSKPFSGAMRLTEQSISSSFGASCFLDAASEAKGWNSSVLTSASS